MPDNSPCTCPVVWEFTPDAGTPDPTCPVDGGAAVLLDAADRAGTFDPELEATLRDLAADYAGPYTDPEESE